jgi:hypothetical protein
MLIVRQRSPAAVLAALLIALLFAASGNRSRHHPAPGPGADRSTSVGPGLAAPCNAMVASGP